MCCNFAWYVWGIKMYIHHRGKLNKFFKKGTLYKNGTLLTKNWLVRAKIWHGGMFELL